MLCPMLIFLRMQACGFGRSTLNRLYDDAIAKADHNGAYHMSQVTSNPFESTQGPGYVLSGTEPEQQKQEDFIVQNQRPVAGDDPLNSLGNAFL